MPSVPPAETIELLMAAGLTGEERFLRSLIFPNGRNRACDACSSWSGNAQPAVARLRGMENARSVDLCVRHVANYATQRISAAHHDMADAYHESYGHLGTCAICNQPGYSSYYPGHRYTGLREYVHTSCADRLNRCTVCRDYRMPGDDTACCAPGTRCVQCHVRYDDGARRWERASGQRLSDGRMSEDLDWCTICFGGNFSECTDCHEFADIHAMYARYDRNSRVCHSCFDADESYERCSRHGYVFREETGPECCSGDAELINSYSFRPRLRFRGDGPVFLGMELEVETRRDRYRSAQVARAAFGTLVYMKEDGSIRSGFEMVTHPMSAKWFVENYNFAGLATLAESGAYAANNCGIHVHVNKAGFSSAAHDYRWLAFMAKNEQAITTLARRSSSYAQFGRTSHVDRKLIATKKTRGGYDRYSAVNVNNEHTYEVRVFASSLEAQTVAAAVLFVDASVEYTRQLRSSEVIRSNGWGWAAFVAWLEKAGDHYTMLRAELSALGIGMPADPSTLSNLDNIISTVDDIGYGEGSSGGCTCDMCRPDNDNDNDDDDYY